VIGATLIACECHPTAMLLRRTGGLTIGKARPQQGFAAWHVTCCYVTDRVRHAIVSGS